MHLVHEFRRPQNLRHEETFSMILRNLVRAFERCYVTNLHCAVFRINQEIMRQSAAKNQSKIFDFQTSSTGLSKLKLSKIVSDSLLTVRATSSHNDRNPRPSIILQLPLNKMQETREILYIIGVINPGAFQTQNEGPFELTSDRTVNEGHNRDEGNTMRPGYMVHVRTS